MPTAASVPAGSLGHHRRQFGDQAGLDQGIGQRADGGSGQPGGGRDVGARRRGRGVDDDAQDQS
jgi:hypothetical protein